MESIEARLEALVQKGQIRLSEGFALSTELKRCRPFTRDKILEELESGKMNAQQALDELRQPGEDQDFQQFTRKLKEVGREVASEVEKIAADFDKERFKSNMQNLFNDLSETFRGKSGPGVRTAHGNYHSDEDLTVLDQWLVEGDCQLKNLTLQGKMTVNGDLELRRLEGKGNLRVKGDLICKDLDFAGEIQVDQQMQSGRCRNSGRLYVRKDYTGADMDNRGMVNCQGDMQLIKLKNSGTLSCDRNLRSDRIQSGGVLNSLSLVQADIIEMSEGKVRMMEGTQIHLGKDASVDDLAYRDSCTQEEGARVLRKKQIP